MNEQILTYIFLFFVVIVMPLAVIIGIIRHANQHRKYTNEGVMGLNDIEGVRKKIVEAKTQNGQGISNLAQMLNSLPTALNRIQTVAGRRKELKASAIEILETFVDLNRLDNTKVMPINSMLIIDSIGLKDYDKEEFPLDIKIIRLLNILNTSFHQSGTGSGYEVNGKQVVSISPNTSYLSATTTGIKESHYYSREIIYQTIFWPVRQNEPGLKENRRLSNLRHMIVADEIINDTAQARIAVPLLIDNIANEKARWIKESNWGTGLAVSLLLGGFGTLLSAVMVSMAKDVALDATSRQTARSLLLLTPETINSQTFSKMSDQACLIAALHACGTGLAKMAVEYPSIVKDEFLKLKHSQVHEKAVLAFALAVNGDLSVIETLRNLSVSNDWLAKILAFEGLIALANNEKTSNDVKISEQIAALDDRDLRVSTYIAHVLASTQNPLYQPQLVKLAESREDSLRMASLQTLFVQARNGDEIASTKLKSMAEQDKDKNVREQAEKYVIQLRGGTIIPSPQSAGEHATLEHEKKKSSNQNVKIIASIIFGIIGCTLGCMGILGLSAPPDTSTDSASLLVWYIILCFVPAFLLIISSIGLGIWAARGNRRKNS